MKLRQLPEDFKVEEISEFNIKDKGSYKLYLLEKKGLETFSLLRHLSAKNNIPFSELGIAGLKDKHAVTKQFITIPSKYEIKTLKEENCSLTLLGFVEKKIELGDLTGNKFEITVRDIKKSELEGIKQKAESLEKIGIPNYFDSQRFGSVIDNKFIAKELIKKSYEEAVKLYLTSFSRFESHKLKEEKKKILQNWANLSKIKVKDHSIERIVNAYLKRKNWLDAYKAIPSSIREIIVSAYQSYLWNQCIKEVLKAKVNMRSLYYIKYNIGSLIFYRKMTENEAKEIPSSFKTISENMKPEGFEADIISKVLAKEGILLPDFGIKQQTGNYFISHERQVIIKPANFKLSALSVDELNDKGKKNIFKALLSFSLPKGSYATIVTKRLFGH